MNLDPAQLFARGLSPTDVSDAINAQHLVLPSGTAKIGERKYAVRHNGSPTSVEALNDLPIRDVYLHQRLTAPELLVTVDRNRASGLALSQRDVASDRRWAIRC